MGQNWETIVPNCIVNDVPTLSCLPAVFGNVVNAALIFAGVVALILVILSGIKFITSSGDPKQVEGAKKTMTFAIIGLVIILLSFLIIKIIGALTGTECITVFGFESCK